MKGYIVNLMHTTSVQNVGLPLLFGFHKFSNNKFLGLYYLYWVGIMYTYYLKVITYSVKVVSDYFKIITFYSLKEIKNNFKVIPYDI